MIPGCWLCRARPQLVGALGVRAVGAGGDAAAPRHRQWCAAGRPHRSQRSCGVRPVPSGAHLLLQPRVPLMNSVLADAAMPATINMVPLCQPPAHPALFSAWSTLSIEVNVVRCSRAERRRRHPVRVWGVLARIPRPLRAQCWEPPGPPGGRRATRLLRTALEGALCSHTS